MSVRLEALELPPDEMNYAKTLQTHLEWIGEHAPVVPLLQQLLRQTHQIRQLLQERPAQQEILKQYCQLIDNDPLLQTLLGGLTCATLANEKK